jgi:murein DD-endopeptidase MepM/ murein hydrolase activator NlpD
MAPPPSSRLRRLGLVGLAALCLAASGLGALGLGTEPFADAADYEPMALNAPGGALKPAERLRLAGKLMFPVDRGSDCYVLDNFGEPRSPTRLHEGVDIMGSAGRAVYAVAAGTLTQRYTNTGTAGWGWTLYDASTKTTYKYFHLAEDPNGLVQGAKVSRGDVLGFVGNSGTSGEDNFHLHFEVRPNNVAVNALPLFVAIPPPCRVSPPLR